MSIDEDLARADKALKAHLARIGISEAQIPAVIQNFRKGFIDGHNSSQGKTTMPQRLGNSDYFINILANDVSKKAIETGLAMGVMVSTLRQPTFDVVELTTAELKRYRKFMITLREKKTEFCPLMRKAISERFPSANRINKEFLALLIGELV